MAIEWRSGPQAAGPVRVVPWPGDPAAAQLLPVGPGIDPGQVSALADSLRAAGATRVLSGPSDPHAAAAFLAAGFTPVRTLVVLRCDLSSPVPRSAIATRTAPARLFGQLLALDAAAFGSFWTMDRAALERALLATPVAQVRAVSVDQVPRGYAVAGRAGVTGYLQRLAVHPEAQGQGLGRALVAGTLRWMRRHRATSALVNTEDTNEVALALYRRFGFVEDGPPLVIAEAKP